ncbi:hypothetical protein M758_8G086700 [Ceratodon purpureus]|nr:hypothetical protein M758_8G086700 [Ceratodon purpureus]
MYSTAQSACASIWSPLAVSHFVRQKALGIECTLPCSYQATSRAE